MRSHPGIEFYLQLVINFLKERAVSHIDFVIIGIAHISGIDRIKPVYVNLHSLS